MLVWVTHLLNDGVYMGPTGNLMDVSHGIDLKPSNEYKLEISQ